MTTTVTTSASRRARPRTAGWADAIGSDLALEACAGGGERISRDLFVDVHSLCMLPEVIEP
jgi:hypothetical protein